MSPPTPKSFFKDTCFLKWILIAISLGHLANSFTFFLKLAIKQIETNVLGLGCVTQFFPIMLSPQLGPGDRP